MKNFISYLQNERFAVGTTGRSVCVFDTSGKELAVFHDLKYAYLAAFTPAGDKLIVKSNEGWLALYSLNELKLIKKLRAGRSPQNCGFCFSHDGTRLLNIVMRENPRSSAIAEYSVNDLSECGTLFSSSEASIADIECGDEGEYLVIGKAEDMFAGVIGDGALIEKLPITFEQFMLYSDALRLKRTGYTREGYKGTFAGSGMIGECSTLEDFKAADLSLKKLIEKLKCAQ